MFRVFHWAQVAPTNDQEEQLPPKLFPPAQLLWFQALQLEPVWQLQVTGA
jgi:hypothetical protein